jgi:hypothetical protein
VPDGGGERLAAAHATGLEYPRNRGFAFWHSRWSYRNIWVRLTGPGRVAVQSVYTPPEDTEVIQNSSYATQTPLVIRRRRGYP